SEARGLAQGVSPGVRRGAPRRGRRTRRRSPRTVDRARRAHRRDARVRRARGEPLSEGQGRHVRRVLSITHGGRAAQERGADPSGLVKTLFAVLLAVLAVDTVIPAGTHIPIRFVERVTSGKDTVGTAVLVQTMGAVVSDSCVVVPPYLRAIGHVVVSKGGGRFGRHGKLGLRFDSLEVGRGRWVPIAGLLDTLEHTKPALLTDSGLVSIGSTGVVGVGKKIVPGGVAAAADIAAVPVALLGGYSLM